jgi:hypothetical protein
MTAFSNVVTRYYNVNILGMIKRRSDRKTGREKITLKKYAVYEMITLKQILNKLGMKLHTGLIWLRLRTSGRPLWTGKLIFKFHKSWEFLG